MANEPTATTRSIAFLRAINVGGHTVKMDRLRDLFRALDLAEVETFIASGNVIFTAPTQEARPLEERIERHLHQSLGYPVATFLRTTAEVAAVAAYTPPAAEGQDVADSTLYIGFLPGPPSDTARRALSALSTADDDLHLHGRELYWLRRGRISDSPIVGPMLEKALGLPMTLRNATTVRKLAAKYPAP
jgi:uncharacterized protein (DUF1697 family)